MLTKMGEDAQLEEADEGYGLSPALDESLKFDDEAERWICSIDGVINIAY
ncbi:hypothetical protein GCK32_021034 [Trichostrongylus colubriformis]|uniref:Uncharacterized protein n=1 Tax=Trichostrongylus colubriformis TaxID=6319 RepID=A0AAN8ISJ6_TRICO